MWSRFYVNVGQHHFLWESLEAARSFAHQSPILWTKIEIEIELGASVRDRDRASKLDLDL
jgi:hypothetical protein